MAKKLKTNTKKVFQIIKGHFEPDEANEIINYLIKKKIDFHQIKNLSTQERIGENDLQSLKRIDELRQTEKSIRIIINEAKKEKKSLTINSKISIEII